MNKLFKYGLILLSFLLLNSCERLENINTPGFSCSECFQQRPEWVQLNIAVTINDENPFVPITIYVGNVEDNIVDWVDTTYNTDYWVDVKPDRDYSVKAEYKDGSKTIFAIDGDNVKLKYTDTNCDEPCYYQVGGYMDVRLRDGGK